MLRRTAKKEPWTDVDNAAASLAFAKDRYRQKPDESTDTRELSFRKIHPDRCEGYKRWLKFQPCSIEGLTDSETGQPHVCWSPEEIGPRRFASDPAHTSKAGMGLKGPDSGCISLCRHGHRLQESQTERFGKRFGIDCYEIAKRQFAKYLAHCEKKGIEP